MNNNIISEKKVNWNLINKEVFHTEYGKLDLSNVIPYKTYEIISIIPLLKNNSLLLILSKENKVNYLRMIDIRYNEETNTITSSSEFKFFISGRKLKRLKSEIKSCCREEGTMGIGFFLRRLSALRINNFASGEFLKSK